MMTTRPNHALQRARRCGNATHPMKTKLTLFTLFCLAVTSHARIGMGWTYEQLKTNATLVVIATPVQANVTEERTPIAGSNVEGKGLETIFEVLSVLKGNEATNRIVLHHFALARERKSSVYSDLDPRLISFEPKEKKQYLMFLRREADGRYFAVSGQYDPVDSIHALVGGLSRW